METIPSSAPHYTMQYLPFITSGVGIIVVICVVWFFVIQFRYMDDD